MLSRRELFGSLCGGLVGSRLEQARSEFQGCGTAGGFTTGDLARGVKISETSGEVRRLEDLVCVLEPDCLYGFRLVWTEKNL